MKVVIVDYGMGNIFSIFGALKYLGIDNVELSNSTKDLKSADKLILPGVGNFYSAVSKITELGLGRKLNNLVINEKKPILGICRGFQLISKLFGSKITKAKEEVRKKYKITIKEKIPQILNAKCYFNYTINKIPKGFKLIAENKINMKITPWMIKSNNQICECWMIHPEREKIFNKILLKRAKNLFKKI